MSQNILQPALEAALEEELALRRAPAKATKPFIFYEEPVWIVRRMSQETDQPPEPESVAPTPQAPEERTVTPSAAENSDPPTGSEPPPPKRPRLEPRKTKPRRKPRLTYHEIRCTICNHPEREAIEQAFLQWHRPGDLAREFKITHRTAIYRHAKALGLFQRRAREMHFALGRIIEEAEHVKPTANSIIRAIRASSCLDENGHWTEPPRRIIITNVSGKNLCPACLEPKKEASETSRNRNQSLQP